jgi:hypothetical protein
MIRTGLPNRTSSVYSRTKFLVADPFDLDSLLLTGEHTGGIAVWINGKEVYRSPGLPSGVLEWNARYRDGVPADREHYQSRIDLSERGIPALQPGENLLAIGVWTDDRSSHDLFLDPHVMAGTTSALPRGPYLQSATPSSIVVRWRTDQAVDSRVIFGTDQLQLTSQQSDPTSTTEHVISLSGLDPDTKYYYAVGTSTEVLAGGDAEHFFVTSPIPGAPKPTRIWILGDSGTGNANSMAVRDAYYEFSADRHTDLWLMLGDNAYPYGTDTDYQAAVFDVYPEMLRSSSLWPTLGNHDGMSADSDTQSGVYYSIFTLPTQGEAGGVPSGTEAYYSFDFSNIHFVVLDSHQTNRSLSAPMLIWLNQDLASTTQDWVVAYWHHPPYSKGSHDSDNEWQLIEMRENALPILENHGVDLVLTGHSHSYERSFLIDGHYGDSDTFEYSMIVDGGDGREGSGGAYEKPTTAGSHSGAVYTVAGSSGKTSGGPLDHPVMLESLNVLGSVVLDVTAGRLDAAFIDDQGALRDHFSIDKSGQPVEDPPPPPTSLAVN